MTFKTLFTSSFLIWTLSVSCQNIALMTFNIRYDEPHDLENNWQYRRDAMIGMISDYKPAFLGIQEGLAHQVTFIDSSLAEYKYIGVGRDDGRTRGEFSAIFYNTSQFECIKSGTFWLSETPDTVSIGWDAAYTRICTYGLFMHKATRERLWVFNTHFDHLGKVARKNSAQLILDQIDHLTDDYRFPVVLMGDFNATPEEESMQIILQKMPDALGVSALPLTGPKGTFNSFRTDITPDRRIDYVFIKYLQVLSYAHLEEKTVDNRWISDHLPVLAMISLNAGDKD